MALELSAYRLIHWKTLQGSCLRGKKLLLLYLYGSISYRCLGWFVSLPLMLWNIRNTRRAFGTAIYHRIPYFVLLVNGAWGDWTAYQACSETCGTGQQTRYRYCNSPRPQNGGAGCPDDGFQTAPCNYGECPGHTGLGETYSKGSVIF